MDLGRLDNLARSVATAGSRRSLLGLLAALPVGGNIVALLRPDEVDAKDRRRRRKQRHSKRKRPGNRNKGCQPKSKATVCAGKCGPVKNRQTCGNTVDCGSCDCPNPCGECLVCQSAPSTPGVCVPDPEQVDDPCGTDGQVCQADGACACDATSCANPTPICADGACVACSDTHPCPRITSFIATPETIDRAADETATLSWSTTNATTCTLDDGSGPESIPCTSGSTIVGPAATTTYTLSAIGPAGGSATDEVTVTVEYCHSITSPGHTCVTGETQFCRSQPISATSSDDARAACEACMGAGQCVSQGCGATVTDWAGPAGANSRVYQYGGSQFNGEILGGEDSGITCVQTGARWAP